jgi:glycosyltransferase involved in cell wall biosynthesis
MRIAYYTHTAFFEVALSLVRALSSRAEVHLIMEVGPDAWQSAGFDLERRHVEAGIVSADSVLADAFPAAVRGYWQQAASFHLAVHASRQSLHPASVRVSREVLGFVEHLDADLLHVDDVDVSPRLGLAMLARSPRVPMVISVHDPEPHSGERNWRKRLGRRLAYRAASRFVLHNGNLRQSFCRREGIRPDRTGVVHLGAYEIFRDWAAGTARPSVPTVLFFGRISPYKGLDVLYRAAPLIAAAVPGVRFVVAGRPVAGFAAPPPPLLAGNEARVEVIERYMSNAELARLFEEASVVVCPYTDATQSGVVLTAYGFNRPVVATAVGGLPEYVTDGCTGLLVPPGDADALAAAVVRVLSDHVLRAALERGIAAARHGALGWSRAADEVLKVYGSLDRAGEAAP